VVDATVFLDGDDLTPVYSNQSTTLRRAILSYTYVLERCSTLLNETVDMATISASHCMTVGGIFAL
jgi:hypothetical protein